MTINLEEIEIGKIKGFSKYIITKSGEIFSNNYLRTGKTKIMKQQTDRYGYKYLKLFRDNGKDIKMKVHRLVAIAYIKNPKNKKQINHKDGNKINNNENNLEWATSGENQKHAWKNKLRTFTEKQKIAVSKNIRKAINSNKGRTPHNKISTTIELNIINDIINNNLYKYQIANKYNIASATISAIIKRQKQHPKLNLLGKRKHKEKNK